MDFKIIFKSMFSSVYDPMNIRIVVFSLPWNELSLYMYLRNGSSATQCATVVQNGPTALERMRF